MPPHTSPRPARHGPHRQTRLTPTFAGVCVIRRQLRVGHRPASGIVAGDLLERRRQRRLHRLRRQEAGLADISFSGGACRPDAANYTCSPDGPLLRLAAEERAGQLRGGTHLRRQHRSAGRRQRRRLRGRRRRGVFGPPPHRRDSRMWQRQGVQVPYHPQGAIGELLPRNRAAAPRPASLRGRFASKVSAAPRAARVTRPTAWRRRRHHRPVTRCRDWSPARSSRSPHSAGAPPGRCGQTCRPQQAVGGGRPDALRRRRAHLQVATPIGVPSTSSESLPAGYAAHRPTTAPPQGLCRRSAEQSLAGATPHRGTARSARQNVGANRWC